MQTSLNFRSTSETNYANELVLTYKRTPVLSQDICKTLNNSIKMSNFLRSIRNAELDIRESFYVVCLNTKLGAVGYKKIAEAGLEAVLVDMRLWLSTALLSKASKIVVAHNHPSGAVSPSNADLQLTKRIVEAGEVLSVQLLDHIILTSDAYYSLKDNADM